MKRTLLTSLLGALLLSTAQAGSYRVQAGDSMWGIARKYGVSIGALLSLNGRRSETLRAGEVLRVPDQRGAATVRPASFAPPAQAPAAEAQQGQAVYYGGRFDPHTTMTAAHLTLPFGTWVRVTHARTGRTVDVMINDRGPFGIQSRIIDLSTDAARALGILGEGIAPVSLSVLSRP
ncbi:LysM peptidoglycan-binding domain-containing protein [Deinococcus taeanensis]|uniref:septal ring lytic transglycosylase RlpA family protein n=1 Tax=Deinococcus taeanensis TaxID=2737050 RepID=UPI001CDB585E|nr:RlpA-like double-psi beta-barrel domain-containing protein [Deinococcus taeanensis]UBV43809.1 LysM peptidoglycan-binding domain-containing protein [Deinococcus taeanensis]